MPIIDVKVYYLEMHIYPGRPIAPPFEGLLVMQARNPTVAYYRFLYNAVGKDYHWLSRGKLSDPELARVIQNPLDEIHVLYVNGMPAGFAELDQRNPADIELVQFGLMPGFIGKGLGKYFLSWTIDRVWRSEPKRFWLHTCSLDHPAALPNYLKAGFTLYKEEVIQRTI